MIDMIMTAISDQVLIIRKDRRVTLTTIVAGVETSTIEAGLEEGEEDVGLILMIVTSTRVVQVILVGPDDREMTVKEALLGDFF